LPCVISATDVWAQAQAGRSTATLLWNAAGGIGWTALYGFGAYGLGDAAERLSGPVGIGLGVVGGLALLVAVVFEHRNGTRLLEEARREMRGE
jgi:peptidoglycan/LPS O-acetylase OafA/YrhL